MELTKKQIILVAAVSGAILLLILAAVLIFGPHEGEEAAAPTASPTETAQPTPTVTPTASPEPTAFRLPLVPQWDTPRPTADTTGTVDAFVPQPTVKAADPPGDETGPWVSACDEGAKDILAVGLQDGRAAALLMLRLSGDLLTITALPWEDPPRLEGDLKDQGAQAAALTGSVTGRRYNAWMVLDLGCLPAVLKITGPMGDYGGETVSAQGALSLAMGAVTCMERVSLLKFPALKRAMGDAFASNLSTGELWSLFWTVRQGVTVRSALLPSEKQM